MFFPQSNDDQKLLKITSYLTLRKTSNTGRLVMNSWWGRALWRCRWLHTYYIHFSKLLVSSCVQEVSLSSCSFSHSSLCLAHSPRGCVSGTNEPGWNGSWDQAQYSLPVTETPCALCPLSCWCFSAGKSNPLNEQQCSVGAPSLPGWPLLWELLTHRGGTSCATCHCHSTAQSFTPAAADTGHLCRDQMWCFNRECFISVLVHTCR